jgi:signal transduction histidine kinase
VRPPDPRPSRVRVRLALLYGALFLASGAVLLTITYLLVARSPSDHFHTVRHTAPGDPAPMPSLQPAPRRQADHDRRVLLDRLLTDSGLALVIMGLVSVVLGWLVAGRILRPLRVMTATLQRISARNLHQRLAAEGPRDEIKDLSDTVDGLLDRLERALTAQKRFVANAAHELRTPLTLQHALLEETLIDREATLVSFRSNFQRLLDLSRQQARLLESLLTLAGSEGSLDHHEPIDLAVLTEQVLPAYRTEIQKRNLTLHADLAPARTTGDPALMERLVANLLDNAIGYNIPSGKVEIHTRTTGRGAVLHVGNTGDPIPDDQLGRLFEPFQRMDRTVGRETHHGLGLSIVRAIATAHHATITARNRPEGGLTMEVTFPPGPVAL